MCGEREGRRLYECMSKFAVPPVIPALSSIISVCCNDSLVQHSDWHNDRWAKQTVIGLTGFCQSKGFCLVAFIRNGHRVNFQNTIETRWRLL